MMGVRMGNSVATVDETKAKESRNVGSSVVFCLN